MHLIQLEFLDEPTRRAEIHGLGRIPSVGEILSNEDDDALEVRAVYLILDPVVGEPEAIVRVT